MSLIAFSPKCVRCDPLLEPVPRLEASSTVGYYATSKRHIATLYVDKPIDMDSKEDLKVFCKNCGVMHDVAEIAKIEHFYEHSNGIFVQISLYLKITETDVAVKFGIGSSYDDLESPVI